jgi:hypothetical protein
MNLLICKPDQIGLIELVQSYKSFKNLTVVPYLNEHSIANLSYNDSVISTGLPPKVISEINEQGAEYVNIDFDYELFKQSKHRLASKETLKSLGAKLVSYEVFSEYPNLI